MTYIVGNGAEVKTYNAEIASRIGGEVAFDGRIMSMHDFCAAAHYVLTNTDLLPQDDPRTRLVEIIKNLRTVPGFAGGNSQRFESESGNSLSYPG